MQNLSTATEAIMNDFFNLHSRRQFITRAIAAGTGICLRPVILSAAQPLTSPSDKGTESSSSPIIQRNTVNGRVNPLGIGASDISLSWAAGSTGYGYTQTAYQVRVGTTVGGGDIWDSGRVTSDRQLDVTLPTDVKLSPATRYHWQVRTWDGEGNATAWSQPAWLETGLLNLADWGEAKWISHVAKESGPVSWDNYHVTISFRLNDTAFGVILRASRDGANAYMYQVNVSGNAPHLVIHKKTQGRYSVIDSIELTAKGFTNADLKSMPHTLAVDLDGNRITTQLDGKPIDSRTDGDFAKGTIGFRTYGSESGSVSSVKVVSKAGETLFEPDLASSNPFSDGSLEKGLLRIQGGMEALYAPAEPLPLLRGEFTARKGVRSARVYASALGLYDLSMNGQRVGDQFLSPGWTDYNKRVQYQTYDVTSLIREGGNVLGAALGDGWYRGKVGLNWKRVYGDTLAFIARLCVTYDDGTSEWFQTDHQWKASNSPRLLADLQDGETYDARLEQPGWDAPGFDASTWDPVQVANDDLTKLVPQPDEPIRAIRTLTARNRVQTAPGEYVYDLGQNMVGVTRVKVQGKQGQTVRIRHAEELYRKGDRQGRLYTDNLRTAKATDRYTFAKDGTVVYQPRLTQHGFRYVEITGVDVPPEVGDVQGVVLGSDLRDIGDLSVSDPMLNQLVQNIRWGQRGNFLSIPTDTPARDERLGWTGDISIFAPTASRYQDTRAFLGKWMQDVEDAQRPNGNIPAVVPQPRKEFDETGVGWSDAFITVPYAVWRATGDTQIVRRNWEAMRQFYAFVHSSATGDGDLLEQGRRSWFSGDWLSLEKGDRAQEHQVIATAYFAENTRMMAEMATAMGDANDAAQWNGLVRKIRGAFTNAYCRSDGTMLTGTQTVYALALGMNLIADATLHDRIAAKFVEKLAADGNHLRTGFLGTPWLLPALTSIGRNDLALKILLNTDYPSWGFQIRMGATTMWERWNSIRDNGDFGPVDMNSFNHYAYGAVGDWMFQHLGGLQILEPGYKKSRVEPLLLKGGLNQARCSIQTPYGLLSSEWIVTDGQLILAVTVPANTTAEIVLPVNAPDAMREGNDPITTSALVQTHSFENGRLILKVGSGTYAFRGAVRI